MSELISSFFVLRTDKTWKSVYGDFLAHQQINEKILYLFIHDLIWMQYLLKCFRQPECFFYTAVLHLLKIGDK